MSETESGKHRFGGGGPPFATDLFGWSDDILVSD